MKTIRNTFIVLFTSMALWNCAPLYDHYTYTETIETKLSTVTLMEKGTTPYSENLDEITDLKNQYKKMVIYENGKNANRITTEMWELMIDDKHLVGSYIKLWEDKETLNSLFIDEAIPQIEEAFDLMLSYESKKDKKSENALVNFINNL